MNVDIPSLLRDHGVKINADGVKVTRGWVGMACPFCDGDEHLGWNISKGYFSCWKCGGHKTDETVSALLRITEHEAYLMTLKYQLRPSHEAWADPVTTPLRPEQVEVPGSELLGPARYYLTKRGYDPDKLAATWGLSSTGATGRYKFRVICPIYHDGTIVSFQGRDYTGKQELRWKTCRKEDEVRDHKHSLGGAQLATGDSVAIVEGFTDAWKLGPGAVCTFGTTYLHEQVLLLKKWRRRFVILDSEEKDPNAKKQANKLAAMLSGFGGETVMVELDSGDPGDLPQSEADALMKELGVRR